MKTPAVMLTVALCVSACASTHTPSLPRQGEIPSRDAGAPGYQHGMNGSLFILGADVELVQENGYVKQRGKEGTLAIDPRNGSAFGIPTADAPSLRSPPYGKNSEEHDAFVKRYFVSLGIPIEQIGDIRPMTLLEANGTSDEKTTSRPRIVAYYSVLDRVVEDISVPDSFAWARVDAEGQVVAEGVYWPAISGNIISEAKQLKDALADQSQRNTFDSRSQLPAQTVAQSSTIAIRHSSAWVDSPWEEFASVDVIERSQVAANSEADASNMSVRVIPAIVIVHHYGTDGTERFLPQERRNLAEDHLNP